jgi:hypothetical protein
MRATTVVTALFASLLLAGCGSDVEGTWQSRQKLSNKKRNELVIDIDGAGSLKMYAQLTAGAPLSRLKYDVSWELDEEEEDIDLELGCKDGCPSGLALDFKMECVPLEGQMMDCKATKPFKGYGFFEFELAPETD